MLIENLKQKLKKPERDSRYRTFWEYIHVDIMLVSFLLMLCVTGLFILYSASSESYRTVEYQSMRFLFSFMVMFYPPFSVED